MPMMLKDGEKLVQNRFEPGFPAREAGILDRAILPGALAAIRYISVQFLRKPGNKVLAALGAF